jgi:hypothetical protein
MTDEPPDRTEKLEEALDAMCCVIAYIARGGNQNGAFLRAVAALTWIEAIDQAQAVKEFGVSKSSLCKAIAKAESHFRKPPASE